MKSSKPHLVCTKLRSQAHMMAVAAARLEQTASNPLPIQALQKAAAEFSRRLAAGEGLDETEVSRIAKQREAFASVPPIPAMALKLAIMQRAYDLLWDGDCSGCDALVEFLPEADAEEMFTAWDADQEGEPKSIFYTGIGSMTTPITATRGKDRG